MQRAEGRSGADLAAFRERRNAVGGSESERLDSHGGLAPTGGHKAASIAKKKVLHVMRAVIGVDDGSLRIVPHAAGTQKVDGELRLRGGRTPVLPGTGGFK